MPVPHAGSHVHLLTHAPGAVAWTSACSPCAPHLRCSQACPLCAVLGCADTGHPRHAVSSVGGPPGGVRRRRLGRNYHS